MFPARFRLQFDPVTPSSYAIGQVVYIRTDTPDFAEETLPFKTLQELIDLTSQPRENLTLEKIVIYGMAQSDPFALTLGFIAATRGQKPGDLLLEGLSD